MSRDSYRVRALNDDHRKTVGVIDESPFEPNESDDSAQPWCVFVTGLLCWWGVIGEV